MIEPDMATMIAVLFTDADVSTRRARRGVPAVVDRTFNCVCIDTDTSTSDTAIDPRQRRGRRRRRRRARGRAVRGRRSLTRQIARDGEGAEKLIEVHVDEARDREQAKRVAKAIVNSPLVKTAVHGADPNWGRVAMAIGKCAATTSTSTRSASSSASATTRCTRERSTTPSWRRCRDYMRGDEVLIHVSLGTGDADVHRVGLRPDRRLRPHQRRLHDLTRRTGQVTSAACGCRRRRGSSRRSCSCW